MIDYFYTVYLVYPDTGPVSFLVSMLGVIAVGIWVGIREDR